MLRPHVVTLDLAALKRPDTGPSLEGNVHTIRPTEFGEILWDGTAINQSELVANLREGLSKPVEPTIVFVPSANASYDLSVAILNIVTASGVSRLRLDNICAFGVFGETPKPLPLTIIMPPPDEDDDPTSTRHTMPPDCDWQGELTPHLAWKRL